MLGLLHILFVAAGNQGWRWNTYNASYENGTCL